eukprot:12882445-Prorocentrum_lima.AAC.1
MEPPSSDRGAKCSQPLHIFGDHRAAPEWRRARGLREGREGKRKGGDEREREKGGRQTGGKRGGREDAKPEHASTDS